MLRRGWFCGVLVVIVFGWVTTSSALNFVLGSIGLEGAGFLEDGSGLELQWEPVIGPVSFDLGVGDSFTTDLFSIWTEEDDVCPDDRVAQIVEVYFNLTSSQEFDPEQHSRWHF